LLWESGIQGKSWRLIKEIYKNVENKVVFGDFESDWFEQKRWSANRRDFL
jgi:hypothetical protein